MRRGIVALLAGVGLAFTLANTALAEELTIFWAEWDPANYLQELVNEYDQGDRRQGHGRDHAVDGLPDQDLPRVRRQGRRLRHGRRQFAVAGRGSTQRPLCRPDRFLQEAQSRQGDGPRHGYSLRRISRTQRQILGDPAGGRRQSAGPIARTGSRTPRKRQPSRPSTATNWVCPRTRSSCATSPSSSTGPTRSATASRSTPTTPTTRWRWASSRRSSATAANSATMPRTRSTASSTRSRPSTGSRPTSELYKFTPPGWGKAFFLEDNQAITEGLAAMSMNFFAFFPALANPATNPNASQHRILCQSGRTDRRAFRRSGRPGHLDRVLLEETRCRDEIPGVVHQGHDPEEMGRAWRLHLRRLSEIAGVPQCNALQRSLLSVDADGEGFLGYTGIRRTPGPAQSALYPYIVGGKGTAKEALDGVEADWTKTFNKYKRYSQK